MIDEDYQLCFYDTITDNPVVISYSLSVPEVTIGFLNTNYTVNESTTSGVANIEIGILEGLLQREVVISFSTQDKSALGQFVCKCTVHKPH